MNATILAATPDGKLYTWREQPSPEYIAKRGKGATSFTPTEIKNYPVQGTGGEWAKAAMWLAIRAYYARRNFDGLALLVNQVHDALYTDADNTVALGPRIPDAGITRLRFISYIEQGTHEDEWKGQKRKKKKVTLQFELSGPKHPALELEDGRKVPFVITINEWISLTEKSNFYKLFKRMNHTGEFTHMAQMLGREFLGTVVHKKVGEGAEAKTYANLREDAGYTIRPPYAEDVETGESRKVEVSAALTPLKCFLWDYATKDMWDSIFIDGKWDDTKDDKGNVIREGTSKNYYQNTIKAAVDFTGSPIADILFSDGIGDAIPDAETPTRSGGRASVEADPLENVG